MIALAIIGLVIAVSYSTANRALQVGRRAQERTEALKEAESQIETLKAIGSLTGTNDIFSTVPGGPTDPSFCVSSTGLFEQNTINPDVLSAGTNLDVARLEYHPAQQHTIAHAPVELTVAIKNPLLELTTL